MSPITRQKYLPTFKKDQTLFTDSTNFDIKVWRSAMFDKSSGLFENFTMSKYGGWHIIKSTVRLPVDFKSDSTKSETFFELRMSQLCIW